MRPRRVSTATALSLAAALVVSAVAQAAGVVVCIGEAGHTEVETALSGCCMAVIGPHSGEGPEPSLHAASCGDCTDVQLESASLRSEERRLAPPADLDAGPPARALIPGPGRPLRVPDPAGGDHHGHAIAFLSTVVLLT
jgi:hypothetical protein